MRLHDNSPSRRQRALNLAIAASLVLHALILFVPQVSPPEIAPPGGPAATTVAPPGRRLEARLAPAKPPPPTPLPAQPSKQAQPKKPQKQVLAVKKPKGQRSASRAPEWTVAEKAEMNNFLREIEDEAKMAPTLAQRSLAMAGGIAGQKAQQERDGRAILERIPNSPPVDPFSLEMYLDSFVRKLNRSASFVKSDPRSRGVKPASVMVRINPDGSLRSFEILNMADQEVQVAFIRSVVERAVPFAAFPPDLRKSAVSLGMMICILPPNLSGGFGFSRMGEGQGC